MKIALINPNMETRIYSPWPPLGILYLGTILKNNGFDVSLLDAASENKNKQNVLRWIQKIDPDVVGFTVFTVSFLVSIELAKEIKQWNPNINIILGHYHPTIQAELIIEKYGDIVDFIVRGEGEYILLELCRFLEKTHGTPSDPHDIKGLTFKTKNGRITSTPNAPLITDLDALPFPDRSLLDFNYKWNFAGFEFANSKLTTVISSRGCPFNCAYCACSKFAKQRWRPRSAENIVEELLIMEEQGYTEFNFVDDNFTLKSKRVIKLCELMRREHLDFNWHTDGRVDQTSLNMLRWMRKVGCRSIWFGFESANQRILDLYNKRTKVSQFNTAIQKARNANIDLIVGLFMLGAPTETLDEINNTIEFAIHSDIDIPFFNVVEIWAGLPFWDNLVAKNLIHPHDIVQAQIGNEFRQVERWETTTRVIDILLSPQERDKMLNTFFNAYKSFFSFERKKYMLKTLFRAIKSKFMLNMVGGIMSNIKEAMNAIITFRESKPSGFGTYED
ncbi:MAG: hypothetical protein BAJALOKI1v1_380014 [Promethearchaeota archaeon]|nr:MAG: hypothetical protein BAJALOKI1v1_380014 [Candidatus Lokiarchaeota archaeon]